MEQTELPRFCDYLRSQFPTWKDLSNDEIDFHLFSSLTNKVYKVTAKKEGCENSPLILRHFCGLEGIVDSEKERRVFNKMSKTGFGPKCYAHDHDIRLEQFIPSRCIKPNEYKQKTMRRKLARTMAAMNKLDVPKIENESLFVLLLEDKNYFKEYSDKCNQDIYSEEEKKIIEEVKNATSQQEQDFIKSILPREHVTFSHNDLLQGNVLINQENNDVIFIDYEYAAYNFRGYDIGNMFRESMFDYSYPEKPYFKVVESNFPNDEELHDFLRYYIVFTDLKQEEQERVAEGLINNDDAMRTHLESHYDRADLKAREDELYRETQIGIMLSSYYWLVWGVKMAKTVENKFDYLEFVRVLFRKYHELKKELFNQ